MYRAARIGRFRRSIETSAREGCRRNGRRRRRPAMSGSRAGKLPTVRAIEVRRGTAGSDCRVGDSPTMCGTGLRGLMSDSSGKMNGGQIAHHQAGSRRVGSLPTDAPAVATSGGQVRGTGRQGSVRVRKDGGQIAHPTLAGRVGIFQTASWRVGSPPCGLLPAGQVRGRCLGRRERGPPSRPCACRTAGARPPGGGRIRTRQGGRRPCPDVR